MDNYQIELCDRELCTGCGACVNVCPSGSLTLGTDDFGYYKPDYDETLCIRCGRCSRVCPVLHHFENANAEDPKCYAVAMSDTVRESASSGGVFPVLAADILRRGGTVCGAAWDASFGVEHILVSSAEDLPRLSKSKYMQSYTGDVFRRIEKLLRAGKEVLFSGCPCQVAGLYACLGRDYAGLCTVDLICAQAPSQAFFKKYLKDTFGKNSVRLYEFRSKKTGWSIDTHRVVLNSGEELVRYIWDDPYQQVYHSRTMMPHHCETCHFAGFPRQGDLSIGDYHGIDEHDPSANDHKGISAVLVNNAKGEKLLEVLRDQAVLCRETPLDWVKQHNRVRLEGFSAHPDRDRFYELIQTHSFKQTVDFLQNRRFDIGVVGNWSWPNYGSELTYYALFSALKEMGYSALMIGWPKESGWPTHDRPGLFGRCPYPEYAMEPVYERKRDMKALNGRCQAFIQGSDQLFNNQLYHAFGKIITLDWVYSYKKKIAYAASFGHDYGRMRPELWGPDFDRAEMAHFMQQFDAFSVRENSGCYITKEHFGVDAEWVLDPIFLSGRGVFDQLADDGKESLPQEKYLFSYVLDPDIEKGNVLKRCAGQLGLDLRVVSDGEFSAERVESSWDIDTLFNVTIEQWIAHIREADFIITDSFHGVCLAIIFEKNFIAMANPIRGITRFESLLELFDLKDRMVEDLRDIAGRSDLLTPIDYSHVRAVLRQEKARCREWLRAAIEKGKLAPLSTFDMLDARCDALDKNTQSSIGESEKRMEGLLSAAETRAENHITEVEKRADARIEDMGNGIQRWLSEMDLRFENLQTRNESLNQEMLRCQDELLHKQDELLHKQDELLHLKGSASYRFGRFVTWLPRKIRGGFLLMRRRGVLFTWKYFWKKACHRLSRK